MGAESEDTFWRRFTTATGISGGIACLLVIWAARLDGSFDWGVFFFAGVAVLLCWSRSWALVPVHLRHQAAADAEWDRFVESDWKYVDIISALTGDEIEDLRRLFAQADNAGIRAFVLEKAPALSEDEVRNFIKYFNEEWPIGVTTYIDENGMVRAID